MRVWLLILCSGCVSTSELPDWKILKSVGKQQVILHCTPLDASVFLDGVEQGICSDFAEKSKSLKVLQGQRKLEVSKPGFEKWTNWIDAGGTQVTLQVSLVSQEGL